MRTVLKLLTLMTSGINYLMRDDFTTAVSGGFTSPRAAEPGPGKLVRKTDSASIVSIDGSGNLVVNGTAGTASYDDPAYYWTKDDGSIFTFAAGDAVVWKLVITTQTLVLGFNNNTTFALTQQRGIRITSSNTINVWNEGGVASIATYATATTYLYAFLFTAEGMLHLIKGGAFTSWSLLFMEKSISGNLYPSFAAIGTPNIALPFVRFGSQVLGTSPLPLINLDPVADTIYTGAADETLTLYIPTPAGGAGQKIDIRINVQDANNYRLARYEWNGTNWQLQFGHVVAGSETLSGSATVLTGTHDAIQVRHIGSAAEVWARRASTKGWTRHASGFTDSNFITSTGVTYSGNLDVATQLVVYAYQDARFATLDALAS